MWINIIDYRGSEDTELFNKRTEIFLKQQQDFSIWKQSGHKFKCFTQHDCPDNIYYGFDQVIKIPRGNASQSRNYVLDNYAIDTWIGIWDNDATLYFDKLSSRQFIKDLDSIIIPQVNKHGLSGFIPYNPQQAPYYFRCVIEQKTTMIWLKVNEHRYDKSLTILEDWEYAYRLAKQGHIFGQSEDISLKEYALAVSTIFNNTKDEGKYEERKRQYAIAKVEVENKLGQSFDSIKHLHKQNFKILKNKDLFNSLFDTDF